MTKEINLDKSTLNVGLAVSILSILAIASLAYTRYRLGFISDDELGNSGNIAVFYLLRILTLLTSVASVSLWLFFIWLFKRNQPSVNINILYVVIIFEVLLLLTQDSMLVNMVNSEVLMTLFSYFKLVAVEFILSIMYFFAGIKIRKFKKFKLFGWLVQLMFAPSLLFLIYANWDQTMLSSYIHDTLVFIPFVVFFLSLWKIKHKVSGQTYL